MPGQAPTQPAMLFYVYAHEDEALRQQLEEHLRLLQRQKLLSTWYDRAILPGKDWGREIDDHLNRADLILLLISASFLASDYCYDIEMQRALERYQRGEARVIPVILRPCDWEKAPFGILSALPLDGKAITSWKNQDEAFAEVARHLRSLLEQQDLFSPLKKPALQCTLTGHKDWVHSVAISADNQTIVSCSDNIVKVWKWQQNQVARTLREHENVIHGLAISADGQTIASSCDHGCINIWNSSTDKPVRTLRHSDIVRSIALSPDGRILASGGGDATIKVWNLSKGRVMRTLTGYDGGYKGRILSVAMSADGQTIVSSSFWGGSIKVWDLPTGHRMYSLPEDHKDADSLAISADGLTIASGYSNGTVKMWKLPAGNGYPTMSPLVLPLPAHREYASVAISADGQTIASCGLEGRNAGTIKVWRTFKDTPVYTLTDHPHTGSIAISADGRFIVSGGFDGVVKVWRLPAESDA